MKRFPFPHSSVQFKDAFPPVWGHSLCSQRRIWSSRPARQPSETLALKRKEEATAKTQLVECLPCKHEALGSVPRTTEAQALYGGKYSPNTGEKEPGRSGVQG